MVIKKIIVHPKTFHSDEVIAVAVIRILFSEFRSVPIIRKYPTYHELKDPQTLVIDCGGEYSIQRNNFDHHQGQDIPCACRLVWKTFAPESTHEQKMLKRSMDLLFFRSIDRHDRGICFAGGNAIGNAISAMNYLPDGFDLALAFAELTLRAFIARQKEVNPVREFWQTGSTFGASRRLKIFPEYLSVSIRTKLIEYAGATKQALLLVWPIDNGFYTLHGVQESYTIPKDRRQVEWDGQSAVYAKKQDVIDHALEIAAQHLNFRKKDLKRKKAA